MGVGYAESVSPSPLPTMGGFWRAPLPEKIIFGSRNAYFGVFSDPSECLLLRYVQVHTCITPAHCPVWYSRLTVARLKALEFLQKRVLNIIFPGDERENFNHCQRRNTESRRQLLAQLFFRWSWVWGACPLAPGSAIASHICDSDAHAALAQWLIQHSARRSAIII